MNNEITLEMVDRMRKELKSRSQTKKIILHPDVAREFGVENHPDVIVIDKIAPDVYLEIK